MIPIHEAIETGAWLEATCSTVLNNSSTTVTVTFRFRVKRFEKINLREVLVDPDDLGHRLFPTDLDLDDNVWRFDLDLVNMEPYEISSEDFGDLICIEDEDGYRFGNCKDRYITLAPDYAKSSGLYAFFCAELPPKIMKSGAFAFELPEFSERLFVIVKNGVLIEA